MPITRVASLEEVGEADWSRLAAGRSVFAGRSWHLLLEERAEIRLGHLLRRDAAGRLTAALPLYQGTTDTLPAAASPRRAFDPGHSAADGPHAAETVLLGGAAFGYLSDGILLADWLDPAERLRATRELVEAFRAEAAAIGAWTAFPFLPPAELARLAEAGYGLGEAVMMGTSAYLELPADGMAGYLEALPPKRRAEVRREIRVFERSGLSWEHGRIPEDLPEVAELVEATYRRHGYPPRDPARTLDLLERQTRRFAGRNLLLLCRDQDRLVGAVSGFEDGDRLALPWLGMDYEVARGSALYFNLGYYLPIARAAEAGHREIEYGVEALHAKLLRGMSLRTTWGLVEPPAELAARWPGLAADHNARTAAELRADHGDQVADLVTREWPARAPLPRR